MAGRKLFLTACCAWMLSGCAEIIPLTGGGEDETAPAVVSQNPEQGSLYYIGNRLEMEFDEYISLNDVSNTLSMNPSAGKLTATVKNRKLTVTWPDSLKANTTYVLQFNGTVRDLHESNDSIMQIVFSTGSVIDSLTLSGNIVQAYSGQPAGQMTVGLYAPESDPYTEKPMYAARTDSKGQFTFRYLKQVPYKLFAFMDQNRDMLPQSLEQLAFQQNVVNVPDTLNYTMRVFAPAAPHNRLKVAFQLPGLMVLSNRDSIELNDLTVQNRPVTLVKRWSDDSLLVALPELAQPVFKTIYRGDTLNHNEPGLVAAQQKLLKIALPASAKWRQGDNLQFQVNDLIGKVDSGKIQLMGANGNALGFRVVQSVANTLSVVPDRKIDQDFTVKFASGALEGRWSVNDTLSFKVNTLLPAELCNLNLVFSPDFQGQWIVELTQNEKTVYAGVLTQTAAFVKFDGIEPGQYNVRCVEDLNGNGKWDGGDYAKGIQPERILRYSLTQKLRANWEVEETLTIRP